MKRCILGFSAAVLFFSLTFTSCSGDSKKAESAPTEQVKEQYQCPMKCTEELFNKPGKCPVCEMDLIKITKS